MSLALAVDFGGTKVEAALVDDAGVVLPGSRFRSPTGPTASSEALAAAVDEVVTAALAARPDGVELLGAGIGSAGPINVAAGRISPLNVAAWREYPLLDQVRSHLPGLPAVLRMDGLCITLAEHWVGAAQGESNVMGMIVSTGVGGGLILNGLTVPGPTGNAGHIGHVEVGGFDVRCKCGGIGCVEAVASGPRTVEWAQQQGFAGTTGEDIATAYAAGDPIAIAAVRRAGRAIGQAIGSTTAVDDLDVVAIGGGFSHVTPDLFTIIRETIQERAAFPFVAKVRVVPSGLSGDGPLIGAAALIHQPELLG
ncbi:ROK family protein [Galbitalea soli]|uniref:ROK family protein n=1 Tax=Galbitalea soli TaxID=1268042 RepID=A0A7C9TQ65_9MICO|nr:ROK family protein [Galbitalea soli]NEM90404.1 ROK family protein [Galbitalea soli]NYJ31115.1 glucokinase [Galbitalea soli]